MVKIKNTEKTKELFRELMSSCIDVKYDSLSDVELVYVILSVMKHFAKRYNINYTLLDNTQDK